MLKTFKYASLFALSALTVACGSGGGGGSTSSIPTPTNNANNSANNANNTATNNANSGVNNAAKPANPTNTQTTPITPTTPAANNTNQPVQPIAPVEPVVPQQPVTPAVPEVPQQPTNETTLDNSGVHLDKDALPLGELNRLSVEDEQGQEIATLSGYNRHYAFNGALKKTTQATSLPEILVDQLVVKLAGKAGSLGGLKGYVFSNTIGAVYNASKDPVRDVFYFGDETAEANMPKSGVVTYQGNASRYDNVSSQVKNIGTSTFIADFENKKIKGELAIDGLWRRNISLKEGDIRGNSFSGEAVAGENHALVTRYGEYEGKFFGPNAEELAGKATFAEAQKDLNTSFSAEQIKE